MRTKTSLKLRTTKQTQPQKYYHHLEPQIFQNHQKLVVMIWERVETAAHNLERTISKYVQTDEEVANFQKILHPFINRIKAGEIHPPIEWRDIPGSQCFTEGTLRKYRDLERDYAEFRFALTD